MKCLRDDTSQCRRTRAFAHLTIGVLLWAFSFVVFVASPVVYLADSRYAMLTSEGLIRNHTPDLSFFKIPNFDADLPFNTIRGHHAYQLQRTNGRLLYGFPHGTSFLSIPFVALMDGVGVSASNRDGSYSLRGESIIERLLAALLMATLVAISFRVALIRLGPAWSVVLALGTAFGTQIWSTASRKMWSHTWEIALGGMVVHLLLSNAERDTSLRPIWLSTLLAWMYFVRPTGAVAVIAVSLYVLIRRRADFAWFAATGLVWLAAFIAYNIHIFGTVVPFYYTAQAWNAANLPVHLYWIAFSPSRGLFVFCPIFAVLLFLAARYWRMICQHALALVAVSVVIGVAITCAANQNWTGGWCYGPRYMTDAVPWFVLLATLAFSAMPAELRRLRNPQIAAAAVALFASIAINGVGGLSWTSTDWNRANSESSAALEWSRAQFLAPVQAWMSVAAKPYPARAHPEAIPHYHHVLVLSPTSK
jgi:hypothetical protein